VKRRRAHAGLVGAALALGLAVTAAAAPLMNWPDLLGRPMPRPTETIAYGPGPMQFGDLWLPAGKGPFPVVLMVHGGCWRSRVAKLTIMNYAAADLARRGIAVWNIEYRGVDVAGGGYPGTFADVEAAADALPAIAAKHQLRIERVVALGHSAGGHLAFWLAARPSLPRTSPLWRVHPLPIAGVVSLGGLPDLKDAHARGDEACGADTVERLVGPPGPAHADVYGDTSPAALRLTSPAVQINGDQDPIATPDSATRFAERMHRRAREPIMTEVVSRSGHVELIAPGSDAWAAAVLATERLLGR
jgi:acetyl esterase/lipase